MDVEAEEEADGARVRALKAGIEASLEGVEYSTRVTRDDLVIHVNNEEEEVAVPATNIDAGVGGGGLEALRLEEGRECLREEARRLLETIERLAQLEGVGGGNVATLGGLDVELAVDGAIEEGTLDVDLVTLEVEVVDEREDNTDGVLVRDSSEELAIVPATYLAIPTHNSASLVLVRSACGAVELAREDPLGWERAMASGKGSAGDREPDAILVHVVKLGLDGKLPHGPVWGVTGLAVCCGEGLRASSQTDEGVTCDGGDGGIALGRNARCHPGGPSRCIWCVLRLWAGG
jgi:hypothetical protein